MNEITKTVLRTTALGLLGMLTSGCVAFVPLIESDYQPANAPQSRTAMIPECGSVETPELSAEELFELDVAERQAAAVLPDRPERQVQLPKVRKRLDPRRARLQRLIKQLQADTAVARTHAASDIGFMGPYAVSAVGPLAYALRNDNNKWVRRAAAKSLGKIGTHDVVTPLRGALQDRNKWVAHSAANALRRVEAQLRSRHQQLSARSPESELSYRVPSFQTPVYQARGDTINGL